MLAVRTPAHSLASLTRFAARPSTDTELLGRFVADRDEDAFAELVRRHGPTILAVCRRVSGNRDDADDAFQATFLALARKAGEVRRESLGGWLYTVAVRAARKALGRSQRWRSREGTVAQLPDVPARPTEVPDPDEARAVLEAVAGLSDAYRAAVVLCELEGRSRAAAARELGIPEGTLSSRLGAARRVLAARLRDRGFGASVLATVAAAAASPTQAADARRLVRASAFPSQDVEKLMEAAMHTTRARWALTTAVVVMVAGLVVAGGPPTGPGPEPAVAPKAVVEKADTSRIIFATRDEVRYFAPDGREVGLLTAQDMAKMGGGTQGGQAGKGKRIVKPVGRATPDGRLPLNTRDGFHLLGFGPPVVAQPVKSGGDQVMYAGKEMPEIVAWSADGHQAIAVRAEEWWLLPTQHKHTLIDIKTGAQEEVSLPSGHRVVDWSPDGTWFLTICQKDIRTWRVSTTQLRLCRVSRDGKTVTELAPATEVPTAAAAISPDGKRVAYRRWASGANSADGLPYMNGFELVILDLTTGARKFVGSKLGETATSGFGILRLRWSPDGDRIASVYFHINSKEGDNRRPIIEIKMGICIYRSDAKNNQTIFAFDKTSDGNTFSAGELEDIFLDWR